ncbi:hypothetical protein Tco_0011297 [Tanacetum coccineum]
MIIIFQNIPELAMNTTYVFFWIRRIALQLFVASCEVQVQIRCIFLMDTTDVSIMRISKYDESNASVLEDLTLLAGNPVKRYQDYQDKDCQGILLSSFQDDDHVGQDIRSQDDKDDKDKQG